MITATTTKDLQEYLAKAGSIGFVPTMGALHKGHLSLLKQAKTENDVAVVSIFINPTQFNDPEDFAKYPRNYNDDIDILSKAGCDVLFLPDHSEIYQDEKIKWVDADVGAIEHIMEGVYRPDHFRGVKTVVHKLFEIVKPDKAYFGEKDFQQLRIIQEMVRQLKMPVAIVPCKTEREENGLAMSSRNKNLSAKERMAAAKIPELLARANRALLSNSVEQVVEMVKEEIAQDPILQYQYFIVADEKTLQPIDRVNKSIKARIFIAVFAGKTRLIDNIPVHV